MKIRTKISLSLGFCIFILIITVSVVHSQLTGIEHFRNRASISQDELLKITDFRAKVRKRLLSYYEVVLDPSLKNFSSSQMISLVHNDAEEAKSFKELSHAYERLDSEFNQVETKLAANKLPEAKESLLQAKRIFDNSFIPTITRFILLKDKHNNLNSLMLKNNILGMKRNLLILASLSLLITIGLAASLGKFLKDKFTTLEEGTNEIVKGNSEFRLKVRDNDELTKVSQSFNHMLEALKTSQDLLLDQQQKLLLASKASALGEVATGMGHEINNPLSIVLISVNLLKKRLEKAEIDQTSSLELVAEVQHAADRISKIVNGIRMITRNAEGDPLVYVSLSKLLLDTIDLCQERFILQQIDLKFDNFIQEGEADFIECRSVEISQVFLNLINNAFDAVQSLNEKWIKIELKAQGNFLILDFIDSGSGISLEVQEKMMNPFFTTKEIGKGTGLGLTISKGVIEKYHGQLVIDNKSAHTKFTIILPRHYKV